MLECQSIASINHSDQVNNTAGGELPADPGDGSLPPGAHVTTRVREALKQTGHHIIADSIDQCRRGAWCGSTYCATCRARHSWAHRQRCLDVKRLRYGDGEYPARNVMRHLTILNALVPMRIRAIEDALDQAKRDLDVFRAKFTHIALRGVFELELVDVQGMVQSGACPEKLRTLVEMTGGDILSMREPAVLVHSHNVKFGSGEDEKKLRDWLKGKYPHHRQTKIQKLRKDRSIDENLVKICSYPFKNRHQYNLTYDTDGYVDGRYIGPVELSFLVRMGFSIPVKQMLINRR